jgi:hypothetical protein
MLGAIAQAGTKALGGARFSLVSLMPSAFLAAFVAAMIASGAYTNPKPSLALVIDKLDKSPGWAVAAAFGVFLLAVLLRPFQAGLVQFLEGYWRGWTPLELAADVAIERHRRVQNSAAVMRQAYTGPSASTELRDLAEYARRLRQVQQAKRRASMRFNRYPRAIEGPHNAVDDRLMPTLLGNVLRDGEDNAGRRYGLDMAVVYPRMYPSLSPKLDAAISGQLDILDTTSALCMAFALAALSALPLVARLDWWSVVPLTAGLLSALAYRGAVASARGHGRLLATAFDLHRFDMLNALHYELPVTAASELEINRKLSEFLESHLTVLHMRNINYAHAAVATVPVEAGALEATQADTSRNDL